MIYNKYISGEISQRLDSISSIIRQRVSIKNILFVLLTVLLTNQTFIGIVTGELLKNSYFRYYMETQTKKLIMLSNTATIPYISRKKFEDFVIPLPPLQEQERIVSILDKFDKLCNDISEGLPAEIEARKKQYEYYRDKLLNFEELQKS